MTNRAVSLLLGIPRNISLFSAQLFGPVLTLLQYRMHFQKSFQEAVCFNFTKSAAIWEFL